MAVSHLFNLKSSLPITRTGIISLIRWSSSVASMDNNYNKDDALQSSQDRYEESNAGEVPKVSHNQNHVKGSLIQNLTKIMQGTLLQNNNIHDPSPYCLNASLSPDISPHPGSMYRKHSSSVAQLKGDEFDNCDERINDGGSSSEARNFSSEETVEIAEVYKSTNRAGLATTSSVSPGYCKEDIESMKDIFISTKCSRSLQDHSEKMVPCDYNSVNPKQNENKGILKFVPPGTEKGDILLAFLGWADILEVEISDDEDVYRLAYIYFKNKKELLKAINRTDLIVRNRTVVLESASPMKNVSTKLPEPGWIGARTVPSEIIKNASRTVLIKGFGCKISLRDFRKVLAFCGGNMSGIFFGPSSSSAYVEFETEDDKEMVLAQQPVYVIGKQISILRVDAPRTTVVRVSYDSMSGQKVSSICTSLGKVKHFNWRCPGIVDVHYCFSEWPKIVDILNSLNGLDLDGSRVLAQPATDYPPDVLSSLWSQPEERTHIRKLVLDLLEKLRKNGAQTVELTSLADRFYSNEL